MVDRRLSINEIRGWTNQSSTFRTGFVERHEAAVATPLEDLDPGQIAMLVRQEAELSITIPMAIELLAEEPLLDAGNYRGDLLNAVLGVPKDYWLAHEGEWSEVNAILSVVDTALKSIQQNRRDFEAAFATTIGPSDGRRSR
jgi:hypothetical protein